MTDDDLARLTDLLESVAARDCYSTVGGAMCPAVLEWAEWCESCVARELVAELRAA